MRLHPFRTLHRPFRSRARAAVAGAAVVAAVAGTGLATAGQSAAQERPAPRMPAFLTAGELPPDPSSSWQAGRVARGLPDPVPFCLDEGELPDGAGTAHRRFSTDLDTGAVQVTVVTGSPRKAAALADELEESVASCAADWLRENAGGSASWDDYGTVDAGDGAHVFGVHTAAPDSSHDVHLYGVGHAGRTVTVVDWGRIGTLADAPVRDFRGTVRTAVDKLRGGAAGTTAPGRDR